MRRNRLRRAQVMSRRQVGKHAARGIVHASAPGAAVKIITRRHQVSANARTKRGADLIKVLFAPREVFHSRQRWYLQSPTRKSNMEIYRGAYAWADGGVCNEAPPCTHAV